MPTATDEQSPSPSPSPSPRSPFRLGFLPATPDDLPSSPPPSPSTSPENLDHEDLGSDSVDEWPDESGHENPDGTSSPASTPAPEQVKVQLLTEEELQTIARGGVAAAGEKAHELLATTDGQQRVGLFLADEDDQANIGDPLASIASRHQGLGGKVNPDTKDLLSAMVGLFGYATKQINRRTEARMIDGGAGNPQPMPEPVDL